MSKDYKNLSRATNLSMMVPLQALMTVNLPADHVTFAGHKPFRRDLVTIRRKITRAFAHWLDSSFLTLFPPCAGFHDEIDVMPSLVKPKKITIEGSDGKAYPFLCKPSDDLRKDARLMEFNALVNKLLKKDPETRKRRLCEDLSHSILSDFISLTRRRPQTFEPTLLLR
jgi:serine/threonine-protein kinase ATR